VLDSRPLQSANAHLLDAASHSAGEAVTITHDGKLVRYQSTYCVTILIAPSPSSWPRWPSPARWSAPSSPRSADCERHRHAHDRDPRSTRTKRQESSARRAERRRRKARTQPLCGLNQAVPSSLRNRRHRSRRKTLVQWSDSGDLHVKRDASWGMSV
jgi:hypothetical protein